MRILNFIFDKLICWTGKRILLLSLDEIPYTREQVKRMKLEEVKTAIDNLKKG